MRKGLVGLTLIVSVVASQTAAYAWGHMGHMVVAQIAYSNLKPAARARVDNLAKLLSFGGKGYDPVTMATMMDDFRSDKSKDCYKQWHFVNDPFFDGVDEVEIEQPEINAEERINSIVNNLKQGGTGSAAGDAKMIAYLFHLVGDIHQPLHSTSRYFPANMGGDLGGNSFLINHPKKNLHSFWDAAGGFFNFQDVRRPLTRAGRQTLSDFADKATEEYPSSSPEWKDLSVKQWVAESHDLAVSAAYKGIRQGAKPSRAYQERAQGVAGRRLAMAGYRLAELLNEIYP